MDLDNFFNSEIDKLPEPYRSRIIDTIEKTKNNLESKTYTGSAGAGLLVITVDSQGLIKKLDTNKQLLADSDIEHTQWNHSFSNLCVLAHANAIKNVKKELDEQLTKLESSILLTINELVANKHE